MNPREPRSTMISALAGVLGTAALLGLADVAFHGQGLDAATSAATIGLWIGLAVLPAIGLAGAVGWLLPPARAAASLLHQSARAGAAILVLAPIAAAALGATRYLPPALPESEQVDAANGSTRPATRTHVVLIVLDTLRADHLGVYGGDPTPAFDALAAESTLFERCFAQASWTVPSHASLFTGLYPVSHGASFTAARRLEDRFETLAESLLGAGYRTAAFAANPHLAIANLDQGFELYREVAAPFARLALRSTLAALGGPERWIDEGTAQTVRDVDAFLGDYQARHSARPLFLFVNLLEPHWRHLPPFAERRAALAETGGYVAGTFASMRFYGPLAMARGGLAQPRDLAALRALYRAEVRYQDRLLGEVLESLGRQLDPSDTLLIVTSDHGENLGEGNRFDHVFALNDHLIRVPMLIRAPHRFPAGARRDELCQLVDVPATIRDVAGLPAPASPDGGVSLAPGSSVARRYVYAEGDPFLDHLAPMAEAAGPQRDLSSFASPLRSVRDERFKLVWSPGRESALYDLETDPDELHDLAAREPTRRASLERELERWHTSQPRWSRDAANGAKGAKALQPVVGPEARERLEALGYTQ